ncbi:hypothetical protein ACGYKD_11645 [Sulfitobacter sp. TB366]|uniref:hypothetical protein n=1 Tax=Sulfitobacter sp. TB366 TaxID=3368580 RepID=UPI003746E83E
MPLEIGKDVPWNASWSGEDHHEIRPCRYAGNSLAVWQPFKPGEGKPIFAAPHMVRQRKSIAEMRCTVCGEKTAENDRWWFPFGDWRDGWWVSTESPVHKRCADLAQYACPLIRKRELPPIRLPHGYTILSAVVGGDTTDREFGIRTNGRLIVGHLKLAWRKPAFLKSR